MPRYLIANVETGEAYEVEAAFAEQACRRVEWDRERCAFVVLRDDDVTHWSEAPVRVGSA